MRKTLNIPRDIPKYHRHRTNCGAHSFCAIYDIEEPYTLDLRKHVLLIAATNPLTLVVDGESLVLHPGAALLVGYQVIEIAGPGELHMFVFGQAAVRNALGRFRIIETLMFNAAARPFPPTPLREFYPGIAFQVSAGPEYYTENLTEILQVLMLERVSAAAYSHFRDTLYGPRLKLCLELERRVLNDAVIERSLEAEVRHIYGCSTGRWLEERRVELAAHWLRHGEHEVSQIADAFKLSERKFKQAFRQRRQISPTDAIRCHDAHRISAKALAKIIRPQWMPPPPTWAASTAPEFPVVEDAEISEELNFRPKPEVRDIKEQDIADFWEMKSTGVGGVVSLPPGIDAPQAVAA